MKRVFASLSFLLILGVLVALPAMGGDEDWAMNATLIEACSCPMFCTCYFNSEPAAHHGEHGETHFCKFNNAFQVNSGHHGETSLDGINFWVSGDLGSEFDDGKMNWAVLTFDESVTPAQREGVMAILGRLYPVEWESFEVADDADIEWTAGADRSVARMDGGKTAEVILVRKQGTPGQPPVIQGLQYWGAPRNDGFVLMPNEVEAYRVGDRAFEFGGGNGFMITVDIKSSDMQ